MRTLMNLFKSFLILVGIFSMLNFHYASAIGDLKINLPTVIISSFKVDTSLFEISEEARAILITIVFKIHHPYTEDIALERLEYKIYANDALVETRITDPEKFIPRIDKIIPCGKIVTLEVSPIVSLAKLDKNTINLILNGAARWKVAGTSYFNTSQGILSVPVEGIKTDYPSDKEFGTIISVKDKDWNPIAQAKVTLSSKFFTLNKLSDEKGRAIFLNLPFPNYTLTLKVSKEGYFPYEKSIEVSEPKPPTGYVVELYLITKLTIEVLDVAGMPIIDANVTFSSKNVGNFTKATNASGIAELEIPKTNYTLTVSKKGYLTYEEVLDLSKFPIESKVIQLKPELTWWEQYRLYIIAGVIAVCIIVPIVLRLKRKSL